MSQSATVAQRTRVSVVLCTFNRYKMLRAAIESLTNLRIRPEFEYEVLVVDDGSTDETRSVIQSAIERSSVEIRYIRQDNQGVAKARNTGVLHARGDWVAFFDDDQIADPDWLANLLNAANENQADCVGGPCYLQLPQQAEAILSPTIRRLLGENPTMQEELSTHRWSLDVRRRQSAVPGTGNALVRRDLFDRVGRFSEVQSYGEDLQFFRRAEKDGARFASAPRAVVHHVIPPNRLTPDYLLTLARKAGVSQGKIDCEVNGLGRGFCNAAMRCTHLVFWTLPGLLAFSVLRDSRQVLSKRCSTRFAAGYLMAVAGALSEKCKGLSW